MLAKIKENPFKSGTLVNPGVDITESRKRLKAKLVKLAKPKNDG